MHSGRIIKMGVNKDSLYSVYMLGCMYIFKGKCTLTQVIFQHFIECQPTKFINKTLSV